MHTPPIGVFDSGIGGLTVVRALMERLPYENIVYFGDTARVPYGVKSVETIAHYTTQIASFCSKRRSSCWSSPATPWPRWPRR